MEMENSENVIIAENRQTITARINMCLCALFSANLKLNK